ncbi:MAG: right-handed parallel beta-helix repeat-containing protein [Candidatus Eisenbacteria bacterium]|nr:right-handed parallel beta-helix repeat-containing protein [Candidatus Eisenbacteria bacterium]
MNRVLSAARAAVAAAVSLVFLVSVAPAAVIRIPSDEPTIAAGIAAASAGDTLLLADGSHDEHGLVVDKPLTIAGESGSPGSASINGQLAGRIFDVENANGVVFSGLTFLLGHSDWGGAVYSDSSDVTFDYCVFHLNSVTMHGGAVFYNGGTGTFTDCSFVANDAEIAGGGIVLSGAGGTFTGCYFGENEAWWGGGVCAYHPGAAPVFSACVFQGNRAVSPPGNEPYGGGVYCWDHAAPTFSHCDFIENTSGHGGAGLMSDQECQIFLDHCTFQGNSAVVGAGLETWWTRGGSVTNCEFTGNTASEHGGGVLYEQSQGVVFAGCTFTDNEAGIAGGAFNLTAATPGPSDCTFTGNSATYGGGVAMSHSVAPTLADCTFTGNSASIGGAVAVDSCASPAVAGCTIAENTAAYGGAIAFAGCSTPSVSGSTLVLNGATIGGAGIAAWTGTTVSVSRTIIGFSTVGEAAASDGCPVSCTATAIYGNAGGDWTGIIAGQEAGNHNVATDPLFCGVLAGDHTLCEDSPCLPENNGAGVLIGAHEDGCPGPCGAPVEATSWGSIKAMYRRDSERRGR